MPFPPPPLASCGCEVSKSRAWRGESIHADFLFCLPIGSPHHVNDTPFGSASVDVVRREFAGLVFGRIPPPHWRKNRRIIPCRARLGQPGGNWTKGGFRGGGEAMDRSPCRTQFDQFPCGVAAPLALHAPRPSGDMTA